MFMKKILLLFFTINSYCQIVDTVYFNKSWEPDSPKGYDYYRIIEKLDTVFKITDYYKSGVIQMTGFVDLHADISNIVFIDKVGPFFWYDKHGRIKSKSVYRPLQFLVFESDSIIFVPNIDSTLINKFVYIEFYYKDGKLQSKGYSFEDCLPHFKWEFFDKKGQIKEIHHYNFGESDGTSQLFYNGKLAYEWNNSNDLKNGEEREYIKNELVRITHYVDGIKIKKEKYKKGKIIKTTYF